MNMNNPVILTGLRANTDLQIGNYFGALMPIVEMAVSRANEYQINLFVPDLHSFTTPIDHGQLQANIMQNLRVFVAAGLPLEHPNVHIYRQSYIPAHSELTWILDCFTGMGEMNRMTQFKDRSLKDSAERISVGMFNYPVLMAADILLYNAQYIPVGEDQTQHLEFARDIAERLNNRFGSIFIMPESVNDQQAFFEKKRDLRIKDLHDPAKKMSKSDESGRGVIFLSDAPEVAAKKVLSATTDSKAIVAFDAIEQPGITNLLDLYRLLGGDAHDFVGATQYGPLKTAVSQKVSEFLTDFQARLAAVDDDEIRNKLTSSEAIVSQQANDTLLRVQRAVGLRP